MFKIQGKFNTAKIFSPEDGIEQEALSQVYDLCNNENYKDNDICVMPDAHAGKGCTVGTVMELVENVINPELVGVDIGCGMFVVELRGTLEKYSPEKLVDTILEVVPMGFNVNNEISATPNLVKMFKNELEFMGDKSKLDYYLYSLGSLGGGNHFIELSVGLTGKEYLVIHSGSRNFGKTICDFHVEKAKRTGGVLREGDYDEYLTGMNVAAIYAENNRKLIADKIIRKLHLDAVDTFETIHNYIDPYGYIADGEFPVLRKEAVCSLPNKIFIPLNSRDGGVILKGKKIYATCNSLPHGAGRKMSRSAAKKNISLEEHIASMEGVFSKTVTASTIDESPAAYKDPKAILDVITGELGMEVLDKLMPVLNVKSA